MPSASQCFVFGGRSRTSGGNRPPAIEARSPRLPRLWDMARMGLSCHQPGPCGASLIEQPSLASVVGGAITDSPTSLHEGSSEKPGPRKRHDEIAVRDLAAIMPE